MMGYPIDEVLNEKQCYDYLSKTLHSDGLHCPEGHILPPDQVPHDRHRDPFFDYRCKICGKLFNICTDTIWSGSRYSCITIVHIIRGIVQGVVGRESGHIRPAMFEWAHNLKRVIPEFLRCLMIPSLTFNPT